MNVFEKHSESLRSVQARHGDACPVITWSTKEIKVLPGGVMLKSKNSSGGMSLESDFQFTCLAADFGETLPDSNQILGYLGNRLKIESVTVAAGGLQLKIRANHAAQRNG